MYVLDVLEDEPYDLERVTGTLKDILTDMSLDAQVNAFASVQAFLESHAANPCHVLFMDIEMPDMMGIELAKTLREKSPAPLIVYVTSRDDYMREAFGLNVVAFVSKRELKSGLKHALGQCLDILKSQKRLVLKTSGGVRIVRTDDIVCVYREGRKNFVLTTAGTFQVYQETIEHIMESAGDPWWVMTSRSALVNVRHVSDTADGCLYSTGSDHVEYLSRNRQKDFDDKLMAWTLSRMETRR